MEGGISQEHLVSLRLCYMYSVPYFLTSFGVFQTDFEQVLECEEIRVFVCDVNKNPISRKCLSSVLDPTTSALRTLSRSTPQNINPGFYAVRSIQKLTPTVPDSQRSPIIAKVAVFLCQSTIGGHGP